MRRSRPTLAYEHAPLFLVVVRYVLLVIIPVRMDAMRGGNYTSPPQTATQNSVRRVQRAAAIWNFLTQDYENAEQIP